MNEIEIWAPIPNYEGYFISTLQNVKSIDRIIHYRNGRKRFRKGRNITIRKNKMGYLDTRLCKNGTKKSAFIHVLMAQTFLPNPGNLEQVNHINGVKTDNRICNLEWSSASDNMKHAHAIGLCKNPHESQRKVVDSKTGIVYASMRAASKVFKIDYSVFKNLMKGIKKNRTGLYFTEVWAEMEIANRKLTELLFRYRLQNITTFFKVRLFSDDRICTGAFLNFKNPSLSIWRSNTKKQGAALPAIGDLI